MNDFEEILGELTGIGDYRAVYEQSEDVFLFGAAYRCISLDALIISKRAAGRTKTSRRSLSLK